MLTGQSVYLRLVEDEDLPLIVEWRNTPSVWANFFNKFPLSRAGQREYFSALQKDRGRILFTICLKEDKKPIGIIGLDLIDFCNQSVELGNILIAEKQYRRKGYAEESVRLMLIYCFLRLNMNRVCVKLYLKNEKAMKLYMKCGFRKEGKLRQAQFEDGKFNDIVLMSILRREFLLKQGKYEKRVFRRGKI
jgi:RimJ/RimL family protein N-acetyltransferase